MFRIYLLIILSSSCFYSTAQLNPYAYESSKSITVNHAAVVSAHALATDAGLQVMKAGGNAFDAAITVQLVLAVVYPGAGNLGGGGFMVAHFANGRNLALDYRESAPSKAYRDMFLDKAGNPVQALSREGALAAGVPGTVAGLFKILPYAKLPFRQLIAPAILFAEKGFAVTASQAKNFTDSAKTFLRVNKGKMVFTRDRSWVAGDTLVQPDLAKTLKRIRDKGAAGFYGGLTAKLITAEMRISNGIISGEDLLAYKVRTYPVMQFPYKGYSVLTMPLPSSGGIILQQLLKMTAQNNLSSHPFHSPESVQLITEAQRRAFADRAEYLGDPAFVKVPVKTLISDAYLQQRMKDFIPGKAGNSATTGAGLIRESEQTTHISIIDKEGNAVAVTTTLNDHFGSKLMISGAGFLMNNEMDDFSVKPGSPNMYGAIGNDKNAIAPGKRMLSSMTPTIVLKNNKPYIIVGSPGGTTIPTSVFQTLVNIIDYKLSPSDAVNKPKFHHQWLPDMIYIEKDFPAETKSKLESMGYTVTLRIPIGRTELIMAQEERIKETGEKKDPRKPRSHIRNVYTAVADNRGDDDARGY